MLRVADLLAYLRTCRYQLTSLEVTTCTTHPRASATLVRVRVKLRVRARARFRWGLD